MIYRIKKSILLLLLGLACALSARAQGREELAALYREEASLFIGMADFSEAKAFSPYDYLSNLIPEKPYNIDELLKLALNSNPSLNMSFQGVKASEADLAAAQAYRWPSLSIESSGSLIGNPIGPIKIGAGQLGEYAGTALPPEDTLIYKGMENTHYNFALKAEVPVLTWGKISLGIDLARNALELSNLSYKKTTQETLLLVRGLYSSLVYLEHALKALSIQEKIGARLLEIADQSSQAGFMTQADLINTKITVKEASLAKLMLEENINKILSELTKHCGLDSLALDEIDRALPDLIKLEMSQAELQKAGLKGSIDLNMAVLAAELMEQQSQLARKQVSGLPDIGLQMEISYSGPRFPFLETDWFGQDDWQVTLSIGTSGNLVGNKLKAADAARAEAEAIKAREQAADAMRSIEAFARDTLLGLELIKARIEYAALKQEGWVGQLAQEQALLDAGSGSESEYLRILMEALAAIAEAWGQLAEYNGILLQVEGLLG